MSYQMENAALAARRGEDATYLTTHTVGFRDGCRSGYVARDGRVYRVGPAGHADGRYPYGESVTDVTEEAAAAAEALADSARFAESWRDNHAELLALLGGRVSSAYMVADGVNRAMIHCPDDADWRTYPAVIAERARSLGYFVELHPSPLNCGHITAVRD